MTAFGNIQAAINGITFGATDANGVQWRLTGLDGWGSPGSTIQLTQKPRGPGAFASIPPYLTPRTITPAGTVYAPTFDLASAAWDQLCAAFPLDPTKLTVVEGSRTRWLMVQRQDETLPTWVTDTQFSFTAQVIAKDPRKLADPLTAATGLPSVSGGLVFPFTFPFTFNSTVVSGLCALTNPGNESGPVQLRIDGPVVAPQVTHVSTGAALIFAESLTLGAGEYLIVDMDAQTALANGTASRNSWITSRGWSAFDPGVNTWAFTAASGSGELTVTAWPAWQ